MKEQSDVLAIKRWWRFRKTSSLWANFLNKKYCMRAHCTIKKWASGISHIWKSMTKGSDIAEAHMIWKINSGNCSFWWDNWSGMSPLASQYPGAKKSTKTLVRHFITNGHWHIVKLHKILSNTTI